MTDTEKQFPMCPWCGSPEGSRIRGGWFQCGANISDPDDRGMACPIIEALRTERDALQSRLDRINECRACEECGATDSHAVVQAKRMRVERDRYREALERIAEAGGYYRDRLQRIARAALNPDRSTDD